MSSDGGARVLTGHGAAQMFDGPYDDPDGFRKPVQKLADVGLRDYVCTSGGNSGVHCGIKVTDMKVSFKDGYGGKFLTIKGIQQDPFKIAQIQGDSGGPVLVPYRNGKVGAVGMIQGYQLGTTKGCGPVHDRGSTTSRNKCSRIVLFSSMRTIIKHVPNASLLTS